MKISHLYADAFVQGKRNSYIFVTGMFLQIFTFFTVLYYFSASGTHFCWRLNKPQGQVRPEGLGGGKKFIHLIGCRTCDLLAYSTVP
jgi:hypothetical protein